MSEKKSPESPQTTRTSLKSYASRVFQESSVGMVSTVASTTSLRRKIFKILALIFCLIGFFYQCGEFLAVVFQYPTTVDVDVLRPDTFNVPAYTFCDNNGINRRIFCEKYPDRCEKPSEAFCKKYESYCGENRTLVPKKEYYNFHNSMTEEDVFEFNDKLRDFIWEDFDYDLISGPYLRIKDVSEIDQVYICYSLNDRVNNDLDPFTFTQNKIMRQTVDKISFRVRGDEMFLPGNQAGILFALHSPFEAVNPFEIGIFMRPGRTYKIYVSMEEEVLLKRPYDTDCMNYSEIWEKNGRSGPRSQDMCKHDCMADVSILCVNCIIPVFYFPRDERYCTAKDVKGVTCPDNAIDLIENCDLKCKDDCRQTKYRYNVQERFRGHFDNEGNTIDEIDNVITVEVYIEEDEVIIFQHSAKYMTVEVFSNIGGFVGCWLGISLLDITDIFEGFFRIFRYSFKRR